MILYIARDIPPFVSMENLAHPTYRVIYSILESISYNFSPFILVFVVVLYSTCIFDFLYIILLYAFIFIINIEIINYV